MFWSGLGARAVRSGTGNKLFVLIQNVDAIIRIIKSRENSGVLVGEVTKTVKPEIKETRRQNSLCVNTTYDCFTGSTCGFFISWIPGSERSRGSR